MCGSALFGIPVDVRVVGCAALAAAAGGADGPADVDAMWADAASTVNQGCVVACNGLFVMS